MSRGSYPLLLTMALSAPGAAHALGLGDIHIDSNLNQPLSAKIDIIGASEQDLSALRAAVANRDVFQQLGADRPSFLSTAHFKVSHDAHGRPVLSVRSSEAFTDPVVNLVIELHWPTGALVREYTLLLDPAGLGGQSDSALDARWSQAPVTQSATVPAATAAAQAPSPVTATAALPQPGAARHSATRAHAAAKPEPVSEAPAAEPTPGLSEAPAAAEGAPASGSKAAATSTATPTTDSSTAASYYTVRNNDTLQGIAREAGAQSAADVRRMMVAMFRANPGAFDDNINRLRSGSVLLIPDASALASLTSYEVNRDYRAQMSAWRLAGRPAASQDAVIPTPAAKTPVAGVVAAAIADPEGSPSPAPSESTAELEQRVQALQASLADMDQRIAQRDAQLFKLRQQAAAAAATPVTPAPEIAIHYEVQPTRSSTVTTVKRTVAAASTLGSIAALIALIRLRRRKPDEAPAPVSAAAPPAEPDSARPAAPAVAPQPVAAAKLTPPPAARTSATATFAGTTKPTSADEETIILDTTGDTTKNFAMDPTVALSHEEIMADLENTAHHVNMPSDLNSPAQATPFVERRKSVIDVLRVAIEREPHRRELKMKLLEIYYAAAASNQASFLEIAKALARDRDVLATGDWERIAAMGRAVTPNERLFLPVGQAVADGDREEENVA